MSTNQPSPAPGTPSSAGPSTSPEPATGSSPRRRLRLPSFGVQILVALVLAVPLGLLARSIGETAAGDPNGLTVTLSTIGSVFVTLLRTLVPPLIVTAIIASVTNLRAVTDAARLAGRTVLWFGITALIAVGVGIGLGLVMNPGLNTDLSTEGASAPARTGSWLDFITGLVPVNWLGVSASTSLETGADGAITGASTGVSFNALQLVVIALVVGIAALKVGKAAEPFLAFNRSVLAIVQKVLWWVIRLAPLGTLGLLGNAVATYGWEALAPLATFALAVYIGLAIVVLVVYPVLLRAHGLSPLRWFAGVWPAIQLGFVSRSSLGTLPVTERVTVQNLGVPREYASFAVPLGATTKMDGCAAIYPALAAIFVAQVFGVPLGVWDYVLIAFVSVVGSAATAGLTGAIVMLTLTLSTLGLPLEGVGLLLAIDGILDMGRTATNVAGQTVVPTIVAQRSGILDRAVYDSTSAADPFADDVAAAEQLEQAEPAEPAQPAARDEATASLAR